MEATLRRSSSVGASFTRAASSRRRDPWGGGSTLMSKNEGDATQLSSRGGRPLKPGLGGAVPAEPTSWSTCGTVIPMEPAENVSGPAGRGVLRQSGLEWKPKHMKFELLYPL